MLGDPPFNPEPSMGKRMDDMWRWLERASEHVYGFCADCGADVAVRELSMGLNSLPTVEQYTEFHTRTVAALKKEIARAKSEIVPREKEVIDPARRAWG